jgi:hypothetical protein
VTRDIKSNSSKVKTISSVANRQSSRHTTTATFTGQKRFLNDIIEDNRLKNDLVINQEEEQQLVRARLSTRTSSLPGARCLSYYYYQHQIPSQRITTKATIEGQHWNLDNNIHQTNSTTNERSRSQTHTSGHCLHNGGVVPADTSDHSSSFDNPADEEHRHLNRHTQQSNLSSSYNSSRYSQRAVAQFMHERHKARLRRNQKASRMLGMN